MAHNGIAETPCNSDVAVLQCKVCNRTSMNHIQRVVDALSENWLRCLVRKTEGGLLSLLLLLLLVAKRLSLLLVITSDAT